MEVIQKMYRDRSVSDNVTLAIATAAIIASVSRLRKFG
jgi:hypothetical protein